MKFICITWWVLSWIGKGITWASIGALLRAAWYNIAMQKFDGYLNIDAEKLDPYRHGEVFITTDGAKTDLDIGHYERFLDQNMSQHSSYSMWKLYQEIINKERAWDYLGRDVQMIPHVSDLILSKIKNSFIDKDITIIEVGGTVWDIENEIIIESLRQLYAELGSENTIFVHMTYLPYLQASGEFKTKPTQNAVKDLRSRGINPDILVLRADHGIPEDIRNKVAQMTGVDYNNVIPLPNVSSIYRVPVHLADYKLHQTIFQQLKFDNTSLDTSKREELVHHIDHSKNSIRIWIVSPYADYSDAHYSLREALKLAWRHQGIHIEFIAIVDESEHFDLDAICIPDPLDNKQLLQTYIERDIPCLLLGQGAQSIHPEYKQNHNRNGDRDTTSSTPVRYINGYSRILNKQSSNRRALLRDKATNESIVLQHTHYPKTRATSSRPDLLTRPGNIHPIISDFLADCL